MGNIEKAFLVAINRNYIGAGVPAQILEVCVVTPENREPRPCFHVVYPSGMEDFIQISEMANFKIISEGDVMGGKIPKVIP